MNIYRCKKVVGSYLSALEGQIVPPNDRIQKVKVIRDEIQAAAVLFPKLGLDSLYPRNRNYPVDKRKVNDCYQCLMRIASKLNQLRDNQGGLCSELADIDTSIAIMIANLNPVKENGQHPIQGDDSIRDKYSKNIRFLMSQGLLPAFGGSRGECYGLALDYGRHRISLAQAQFVFKETAAEMQTDQQSKHPGKKIFLKRLGQVEYQPNVAKQATGIADYVIKNRGEHLVVKLKSISEPHLCYIQYTTSGNWHYFEPNQGAFEFSKREEFEAFYYDLYSTNDHLWHSYQVSKMLNVSPLNTWSGKWRSFLTGSNYYPGIIVEGVGVSLLVTVLLGIVAALVITPIIMLSTTMLPAAAIMTLMITCVVLFEIVASVGLYNLINNIVKSGFSGLLALPRYIDYYFQQGHENALKLDGEEEDAPKPRKKGIHTIHTLQTPQKGNKLPKSKGSQPTSKQQGRKIHTLFENDCRFLKPIRLTEKANQPNGTQETPSFTTA